MASWVSIPAINSLLGEINIVGMPGRLKAQDGKVGDLAHQERASDHNPDESGNTGSSHDSDSINEVHALDADARGPWRAGWSMERIVQTVLARCRSGAETRLKYIIFKGRIWRASNGWKQEKYTGSDQHSEHAHFSFKYGSGNGSGNPENDTRPWGIAATFIQEQEADGMPSANEVSQEIIKDVRQAPKFLSDTTMGDIAKFVEQRLIGQLAELRTNIATISAQVATLAGRAGADVDEAALAKAIVAGLPDDMARSFVDQLAERLDLKISIAPADDAPDVASQG